jgi:hypothetical protein
MLSFSTGSCPYALFKSRLTHGSHADKFWYAWATVEDMRIIWRSRSEILDKTKFLHEIPVYMSILVVGSNLRIKGVQVTYVFLNGVRRLWHKMLGYNFVIELGRAKIKYECQEAQRMSQLLLQNVIKYLSSGPVIYKQLLQCH